RCWFHNVCPIVKHGLFLVVFLSYVNCFCTLCKQGMSQKNYYQLLHVSPQATQQEIKAAYRKLAFKYHPDRNKGNTLTEAVLKEINEAYSVLSNPEKRKFYNASIAVNNFHSKHRRPVPVTSKSILQNAIKLRTFVER